MLDRLLTTAQLDVFSERQLPLGILNADER